MTEAKKKKRAILFALGAHVVKVGLNPIIIDLMKEGWITALAKPACTSCWISTSRCSP